jgi:predicted Zn-ribbon and HTH transcriptional regulator
MDDDWYKANNFEEEDDPEVEVDVCKCEECGGYFELPVGMEISECPLCKSKFD